MTNVPRPDRVEREARLRWVPIATMTVSPLAQREINQSRVDHIVATFDLEQIGTPTVNKRDGYWYVIDGQHRIEALKQIGWGDQQVQCWAYEGLTEQEEAEKFLKLNDYLAVNALAKFRVAVQAGREVESDIDRIVRASGLVVSGDKVPGAIRAVGTLSASTTGPAHLFSARPFTRPRRLRRRRIGGRGLDGLGLFVQRYAGDMDVRMS